MLKRKRRGCVENWKIFYAFFIGWIRCSYKTRKDVKSQCFRVDHRWVTLCGGAARILAKSEYMSGFPRVWGTLIHSTYHWWLRCLHGGILLLEPYIYQPPISLTWRIPCDRANETLVFPADHHLALSAQFVGGPRARAAGNDTCPRNVA